MPMGTGAGARARAGARFLNHGYPSFLSDGHRLRFTAGRYLAPLSQNLRKIRIARPPCSACSQGLREFPIVAQRRARWWHCNGAVPPHTAAMSSACTAHRQRQCFGAARFLRRRCTGGPAQQPACARPAALAEPHLLQRASCSELRVSCRLSGRRCTRPGAALVGQATPHRNACA